MANKEIDLTKYIKIEDAVNRYKSGDANAAAELIEMFQPILRKYKNVICYGKTELSSKSVRSFIKMFTNGEINISQYKRSGTAVKVASDAVSLIHNMFYMYEPNEVDSILTMVLLNLAQKYKTYDGRAQFHSYVISCFHFRVYEQLMILVDDTVNICQLGDKKFHDNYREVSQNDNYDLEKPRRAVARLIAHMPESDEVGDDWILGVKCDVFKNFTQLERKIFKLKFVDKLSDEEVSDELSVCRHTIMRRRQKLVKELECHAASLGMLRG